MIYIYKTLSWCPEVELVGRFSNEFRANRALKHYESLNEVNEYFIVTEEEEKLIHN